MKVAILCPGPSLNRFLSAGVREEGCVYIGVNRAVQSWPCEYWSFGDLAAFQNVRPMPLDDNRKIVLFTAGAHLKVLCGEERNWLEYEPLSYETVTAQMLVDIPYRNYSVLAALILADWLLRGHPDKRVRVYGADMSGMAYYDGSPCGGDEDFRWPNERHHYTQMAAYLMGRGVVVERESQESVE